MSGIVRASAVDVAMRAVLALPVLDQFDLFDRLSEALAQHERPQPPPQVEQDTKKRRQALDCIRRAADYERDRPLDEGEEPGTRNSVPTSRRYDAIQKELDLPMSVGQIKAAWGTWLNATDVVHGYVTANSRAISAALQGRPQSEISPYECIAFVSRWLATDPPISLKGRGIRQPRSTDYTTWAKERRQDVDDPTNPCGTETVLANVGASWEHCLAAARGEITPDDAHNRTVEDVLRNEIIGVTDIGYLMRSGPSEGKKLANTPGFPPYAAKLRKGLVWRTADISAYLAGDVPPNDGKRPGFLANQIVEIREFREIHGIADQALEKRFTSGTVYPDGRVSGQPWWWRRNVHKALTRPNPAKTKAARAPKRVRSKKTSGS